MLSRKKKRVREEENSSSAPEDAMDKIQKPADRAWKNKNLVLPEFLFSL